MDFEQAKKVLQLTETRIKKFGSIDTSTSDEIHKELTGLREQTAPLENSLEQLIAIAIKLNHAEFRDFAYSSMDELISH
jgi:hypothetical protein